MTRPVLSPENIAAAISWGKPKGKPAPTNRSNGNGKLWPAYDVDLPSWLDEHGIAVGKSAPWEGGTKYVLETCPWNPEHADGSAFVGVKADGTIRAGCLHHSCEGKGWYELRDTVEGTAWRDGLPAATVAPRIEATTRTANHEWETPASLLRPELPSFPVDALSPGLREFVEDEAEATQTPLDLAGCLALAATATAVGGKFRVSIRPGYGEPVNIYTAVELPPGERKSAVFRDAIEPISRFEREQQKITEPSIKAAESQRQVLLDRLRRAEKNAAKMEAEAATPEMVKLTEEISALRVPKRIKLVVDDATPERLVSILMDQGERIAILSAEGDVFNIIAGRYAKKGDAPNMAIFLKGHNGDTHRVDRVTRPSEYVERPCITIGLTFQPDVLRSLAQIPGARERGLIARFLLSLPSSALGRRSINVDTLTDSARDAYRRVVSALLAVPVPEDAEGRARPEDVPLLLDARDVWDSFYREIEPRLGPGGDLAHMSDWAGKLPGAAARLAALLHLADTIGQGTADPGAGITTDAMERGISLARYFLAHAIAAYREMGEDQDVDDARHVLRWIKRAGGNGQAAAWFDERRAFEGTKGRFGKVEKMRPALALLEIHGYIRRRPDPERSGPGRRPSPVFDVNPKGLELCN